MIKEMQFKYELNTYKYTEALKANNKINLIKKILINFYILYFEFIMYINVQNRQIKNFTLCVNDDNIIIITDVSEIYIGWESIKSITIRNNIIIIKYGLGKKITLPLSLITFKNENEKLQFKSALEHKMNEKSNCAAPAITIKNIILKIKFVYLIRDEEYFYNYELKDSSRGKLIAKIVQNIYIAYFLIFFILACIKKSILFAVVAILLAYLTYHYYGKTIRNKSFDKLLFNYNDNYNSESEKVAIISDEGIFFENSNVITFIKWEKINNFHLVETNKYIGISNKESVIFWIPVRDLKEKDEFMRTIKKHFDTKDGLLEITKKKHLIPIKKIIIYAVACIICLGIIRGLSGLSVKTAKISSPPSTTTFPKTYMPGIYETYHIDKSKLIINSPRFKVAWNKTNVKIGETIKFNVIGLKPTAKIPDFEANVAIYANAQYGGGGNDTTITNWKTTNNQIESYVFIQPTGEDMTYQYNFILTEIK